MRVNSLILQTLALGAFMLNFRQAIEVLNLGQCLPTAFVTVTGEKGREGCLLSVVQMLDGLSTLQNSLIFFPGYLGRKPWQQQS